MGSLSGTADALARLAQVEALLGRRKEAIEHLSEAVACLDVTQGDECVDEPLHLCFACFECARVLDHASAGPLLERARRLMLERADLLDPADRDVFLRDVPMNRVIQEVVP